MPVRWRLDYHWGSSTPIEIKAGDKLLLRTEPIGKVELWIE